MGTIMKRAKPLVIVLVLLLAACGKAELYSKLSEAQANEMIAVLASAGIDASKQDEGDRGWTVSTDKGEFSHAIEVLHAQGYPHEDFASLGTVFGKKGVLSSPTEEHARLTWGLQQELAQTLSSIDGVVEARVHLALPENQPLAEKPAPSSASVFLKYRPGFNIDSQIGKVKALVVNSVEGLKYENVTVETFAAEPLPTVTHTESSQSWVNAVIALLAVILVAVAAFFLYPRFRRRQQRNRALAKRDSS